MQPIWIVENVAYDLIIGTIGDVILADSNFGIICDSDRMLKRELGGGTILDLGIYCIQFSLLAFNGKRWVSNTNSTTKSGVSVKCHVKVCPILYFYIKDKMLLTLLVIWARLMSQVWTQMYREPSFILMAAQHDSRLIVAPIRKKMRSYMEQKVEIEL